MSTHVTISVGSPSGNSTHSLPMQYFWVRARDREDHEASQWNGSRLVVCNQAKIAVHLHMALGRCIGFHLACPHPRSWSHFWRSIVSSWRIDPGLGSVSKVEGRFEDYPSQDVALFAWYPPCRMSHWDCDLRTPAGPNFPCILCRCFSSCHGKSRAGCCCSL